MDGQTQYIGDGVYASFDGWSVVLRANMPTTDTTFLEPEVAQALVEYIKRVYSQPDQVCVWKENEDGYYDTSCNNAFVMEEGTPEDNELKYCCYCGKTLKQELYQPEPES
jgi:hypothetical protein